MKLRHALAASAVIVAFTVDWPLLLGWLADAPALLAAAFVGTMAARRWPRGHR